MLASQRPLFDMPRDVCFMNAAAWSPLPKSAVEAGKVGAERKSRPWELTPDFADGQIERARSAAAKMINADPNDVALISSVGYGVSTAAKSFPIPAGHRVIVLDSDHSSPTLEWMTRSHQGNYEVDVVKVGADNDWTSAVLETIARPGAKPIALTSISSVHWSDGGLIDTEKIQAALKPLGAALLIDATHSAGVLTMDVKTLDPDFVVFPTYKWLLGPYSRAFLYVAKRHQNGTPLEQTSYGRKRVNSEDHTYFTDLDYVPNARRYDMGERDFFVSIDVAAHSMELISQWGVDNIRQRLTMLTDALAQRLAETDNITLLDRNLRAPHILSLGFPAGMPSDFTQRLASENVYAAARLGRLRVSPHVYNDEEDCARFADVILKNI